MSFTRTSFTLAASIAAGLAAVGSSAAVQSKCLAGKNRCMSKEASSLLKCEQRAEIPGTSIEPALTACRQKARSKFDGATVPTRGCFETLEGRTPNDCITADDAAAAAVAVDDCVASVVNAIDPAPVDQSACNVGKKKCAAKKLKSVLKCHEKAQKPGPHPPEELGECIQRAVEKFDGGPDPTKGCIAKLEARSPNDCVPPLANTAAVEAAVDSCGGTFVALIESTTTTTLPEIHCCDVQISCDFCYPNDRICSAAFLPLDDCAAAGGRPGPAGSVCSGTGTCDATAVAGWCCESAAGGCFSGPGAPEICSEPGFTLKTGVCAPSAGSPFGRCQ